MRGPIKTLTLCILFLVKVSQQKIEIPTAEKFLEFLFNTTALEVFNIAKSFDFDKILSGHIDFLVYESNGKYRIYNGSVTNGLPDVDCSKPVKFIIHGWHSSATNDWVKEMAKSYISTGVKKVVAVDWSAHAKKNYLHSAGGTKKVGEIVGDFIMNLIKNETQHLGNLHVIGHSLGAQIAGFAGKRVKHLSKGKKVSRITGLDAAAPLFEFPIKVPDFLRIADGDADFVDSIHTNAGFMGFLSSFGDADFYVEFGGPVQPSCHNESNIFEAFVCSHGQSHDIFINTITSKSYKATSCDGPILAITGLCFNNPKVPMGEPAPSHAEGDYYLRVNEKNEPKDEIAGDKGEKSLLSELPGLKRFAANKRRR